jgi:hypothetical protein
MFAGTYLVEISTPKRTDSTVAKDKIKKKRPFCHGF